MKRAQNILMIGWAALVVLFALFNWELLWREETVTFLFVEFLLPWAFWLAFSALVFSLLFLVIGQAAARRLENRAAKDLAALKAKAFDERGAEMDQLVNRIQTQVESSLRAYAPGSSLPPGESPPDDGDP